MMTARQGTDLLDRLPSLRGACEAGVEVAPLTWFRVGGVADVVYRPVDTEDLVTFLRAAPKDVPLHVIGLGSNLLVRDGGLRGVVIRMGKSFARIAVRGDIIRAEAGASDISVAAVARDAGLAGLEFLRGIPGTIGGALRMNAGAYGREMKDVLVAAEALDRDGNLHRLTPEDMGYTYRHSTVPEDWIFVAAEMRGTPDDKAAIQARMDEINAARELSQPLRTRTGGSTFKNPDGKKAWELIDAAGCRGLVVGDAQVSEKHCNFLINRGAATAADLETLGETVRERVKARTGVTLQWEIRRIGDKGSRE